MNKIVLSNSRPRVFFDLELHSDVWDKDLAFEKGKSYLIEAESGTGKSSLFSFIYGYRNDFLGNIYFDERNVNDIAFKEWDDIRKTKLSLLFQELRLFPELTAFENIELKNQLTRHKSHEEIVSMLELLGIGDKKNIPCAKLSWGQQQRVAIIRSLCQPYQFLLFDEPISHLDDKNAAIIADLVEKEAKAQDAAIIVSSIGKQLPLPYHQRFAL
ncbi:MAG: transporter related protein [Bacteroidetes bacterium]|nr:transporter related protein [Bacteroidota bacterium]